MKLARVLMPEHAGQNPDERGADAASALSAAARFFQRHPAVRASALASPAFQQWRKQYRELNVDGERLFVQAGSPMSTGGDTLMDTDQLLLEWARQELAANGPRAAAEAREIVDLFQKQGSVM